MLALIKSKWEKKKLEADTEISLQEVIAKNDLFKEILDKETTTEVEMEKIVVKKSEFENRFVAVQVSDLSLGKLVHYHMFKKTQLLPWKLISQLTS